MTSVQTKSLFLVYVPVIRCTDYEGGRNRNQRSVKYGRIHLAL